MLCPRNLLRTYIIYIYFAQNGRFSHRTDHLWSQSRCETFKSLWWKNWTGYDSNWWSSFLKMGFGLHLSKSVWWLWTALFYVYSSMVLRFMFKVIKYRWWRLRLWQMNLTANDIRIFNVLLYRKDVIVIIFFNAPVTGNGSSVCHNMDKSNAQEL